MKSILKILGISLVVGVVVFFVVMAITLNSYDPSIRTSHEHASYTAGLSFICGSLVVVLGILLSVLYGLVRFTKRAWREE